jgi:hypothetical protein
VNRRELSISLPLCARASTTTPSMGLPSLEKICPETSPSGGASMSLRERSGSVFSPAVDGGKDPFDSREDETTAMLSGTRAVSHQRNVPTTPATAPSTKKGIPERHDFQLMRAGSLRTVPACPRAYSKW